MKKNKGQALLPLLFLSTIALTLGVMIVSLVISNLKENLTFKEGIKGYFLTEAALENGLLQLLRNPHYTGEVLQLEGASCIITVNGNLILSRCDTSKVIRKIQARVEFVNGRMEVSNIEEIP